MVKRRPIMAHDVFISYANQDKRVADTIRAALEEHNIRCWIPSRDDLPREGYSHQIIEAIVTSRVFLVLVSSGSMNSPQVLHEVETAVNKGIPIIPLIIEDIKPSRVFSHYLSSPVPRLEIFRQPLEKGLVKVVDTVRVVLADRSRDKPEEETKEPGIPEIKRMIIEIATEKYGWISLEDVVGSIRIDIDTAKKCLRELKAKRQGDQYTLPQVESRYRKDSAGGDTPRKKTPEKPSKRSSLMKNLKGKPELPAREGLVAELERLIKQRQQTEKETKLLSAQIDKLYEEGRSKNENQKYTLARRIKNLNAQVKMKNEALQRLSNQMFTIENLLLITEETLDRKRKIALSKLGLKQYLPQSIKDILKPSQSIKDIFTSFDRDDAEDEEIKEIMESWKSETSEVSKSVQPSGGIKQKSGSPNVPGDRVDLVHFSVTSPPTVRAGESIIVGIWAHLEKQRREVKRRAQEEAPDEEISLKTQGPVEVARGTILSVRLTLDDFIVEPSEATILWRGEIGNTTFGVTVPGNAKRGSRVGVATIHKDGFQIAVIHFKLRVGNKTTVPKEVEATVKRHRTAFASYASVDRAEVVKRIQGMQKALPELDIFMDVASLRSGQNWQQEIHRIIPSRDVFYLFWSRDASQSHWVEEEWRYALKKRGLHFIDPCPLVSPRKVPPPPELESLHFYDRWLIYEENKTAG